MSQPPTRFTRVAIRLTQFALLAVAAIVGWQMYIYNETEAWEGRIGIGFNVGMVIAIELVLLFYRREKRPQSNELFSGFVKPDYIPKPPMTTTNIPAAKKSKATRQRVLARSVEKLADAHLEIEADDEPEVAPPAAPLFDVDDFSDVFDPLQTHRDVITMELQILAENIEKMQLQIASHEEKRDSIDKAVNILHGE